MATIKAMLSQTVMAICPSYGAELLAMEWPDAPVPDSASTGDALTVERGQRYAISRGVAIVPVRGMLTPNRFRLEDYMGWTTYHGLAQTMSELTANEEVRGIVLEFDSPGGFIQGLDAATKAIVAARAVKPVHGLVNPMAMSAAYWLASQCTELVISTGSEVGSIGIMAQGFDPVQPGGDGYQDTVMRSTHARAKNADMTTEEGRALVQQRLDDLEARFHADIASGRGISADELKDVLSATSDQRDGGSVYSAADAVSRGLADSTEDRDDFYERVAALYAPQLRPASRSARALAAAADARARI